MNILEDTVNRINRYSARYIARATGLHYNTIYLIKRGHGNPTIDTLNKLNEFVDNEEAQQYV